MKTKEELNALKNEFEALNEKLAELSEDELKQVYGGFAVKEGNYWLSMGDCFMVTDMLVIYEGLSTQCSGTDSIMFDVYLSVGAETYKFYKTITAPASMLTVENYLGSKTVVERKYKLFK